MLIHTHTHTHTHTVTHIYVQLPKGWHNQQGPHLMKCRSLVQISPWSH